MKSYNAIFNEQHEPKDATNIKPENLPEFDLLCAGFPCQAFSVAGERGGFEDTRGTLFFEIARIAREKLPKVLFLENVKGLLNHANGETFKQILTTLDELGYDVQWQVLNSKYHGVPQNRERVFIVAHRRGESWPEVFPFREPNQRSSEESKESRVGIINRRGDLATRDDSAAIDKNYHKGFDNHGQRTGIIDWHGHKEKPLVLRDDVPTLRAESHGHQPKLLQKSHDWRENNELREFTEYSPTIRSQMGDNLPLWLQNASDERGKVRIHRDDKKKSEIQGYSFFLPNSDYVDLVDNHDKNIVDYKPTLTPGRLNKRQNGRRMKEENDPMFTLTSQDIHGVTEEHESQVRIRKLTPRECWRLQGFPDEAFEAAEKENSDTQLYKQAGNSVTVNVVEDIGERLENYF